MSNFMVIFLCMLAGALAKKLKAFPSSSAQVLSAFVIHVSLPSLILSQIPTLLHTVSMDRKVILPVSLAWFTFILSFVVFGGLGRRLGWSYPKIGALILTAGLGNTSFVGLPLLDALLGPQAIPIGLLVDQPGSFLVLSTLGIAVAASYSGTRLTLRQILSRIVRFPPFVALVLSLGWFVTGQRGSAFIDPVLNRLGGTLVPLALFAVGFQLKVDFKILRRRARPLAMGLAFKLIFVPLVFGFFYQLFLDPTELLYQVIVLEAAMATMITSAVVAGEFDLDIELANLMVGLGIPLSLVTVPFWSAFIRR